jgi:DNA-directed RNA polymerase specialized sigma24 family protein
VSVMTTTVQLAMVNVIVKMKRRGCNTYVTEEMYRAEDEVLDALDALIDALNRIPGQIDFVATRAEVMRDERARGATYAEILNSGRGTLMPEVLTTNLTSVLGASSRLRRAAATALYAEGLSMDKIAQLFGVSRQRVSALLRTPVRGRHEM